MPATASTTRFRPPSHQHVQHVEGDVDIDRQQQRGPALDVPRLERFRPHVDQHLNDGQLVLPARGSEQLVLGQGLVQGKVPPFIHSLERCG